MFNIIKGQDVRRGAFKRKYPFDKLQPGQGFSFPIAMLKNVQSAASYYRKKNAGKKLAVGRLDDNEGHCACLENGRVAAVGIKKESASMPKARSVHARWVADGWDSFDPDQHGEDAFWARHSKLMDARREGNNSLRITPVPSTPYDDDPPRGPNPDGRVWNNGAGRICGVRGDGSLVDGEGTVIGEDFEPLDPDVDVPDEEIVLRAERLRMVREVMTAPAPTISPAEDDFA